MNRAACSLEHGSKRAIKKIEITCRRPAGKRSRLNSLAFEEGALSQLEVDAQRELNLPVRPQAHRALDRPADHTEGAACKGAGEWLPRLQGDGAARREGVGQLGQRVSEVGRVEDVEHFAPKLDVGGFVDSELLPENQVLLKEARPMNLVALLVGARGSLVAAALVLTVTFAPWTMPLF